MNQSRRPSQIRKFLYWAGATVSALLLLLCVDGLVVFAGDVQRRDGTAGSQLGAVLLVFSVAVAFASPLMLGLSPIGRRRWTVAVVAAALIGGSWITGLALNGGA